MKASLLKFKNCLGHQQLEVQPGNIMIIEGREGTGKTSILETIQRTFTNKSERPVFVHSEGTKAESYILLDDGTKIKKIFNKEGKVTTSDVELDGMRPGGSETYLKNLISENQLNPISMIGMKEAQLNEFILSLIPIKITQDDIVSWLGHKMPMIDVSKHGLQVCKELEASLYETRTEVNREIKTLQSSINTLSNNIPEEYDPEAWRDIQISDYYDKVRAANDSNSSRQIKLNDINNLDNTISTLTAKMNSEISIINEKIKQLLLQKREIDVKYRTLIQEETSMAELDKQWLADNPEIDIKPLEDAMKKAEEMKQLVTYADNLNETKTKLQLKQQEADNLTNKLEFIRCRPGFLIQNVKMPVDGLTVDGGGNVLINDRPIKNLSGGERLKLVIKLAMAAAGELKLILIDGFQDLSPETQKEFIREVENTDFQFFFTRVTDGDLRIINVNKGQAVDADTGELLEGVI